MTRQRDRNHGRSHEKGKKKNKGFKAGAIAFSVFGIQISLSGLAVAALVGIILNAVLPGNDYVFGKNDQGDKSVNFKV